ncbi:MAG: type transport system ATP-binding protein [Chloroflexia bacterium]|nr:type transport system ATP-binding protein [Chloroflexia bacterium]
MPPIIEVENLVKRYRKADTNAVDGVSFSVQPGELFTLLGPNGAGKTTTISILTTTLAPTAGSVRIAGHDLAIDQSAVRKSVGIIFQKPSLDMNLTAEENVRFHAIMYGLYPFRPFYALMPRAYKEQVAELAAILGIEGEIFKPVKTFSGGMKRKLEIIRSLIHRPTVLFLDEPTLGLDPASRRSLWEYLRRVRKESGITLFLTTHYLEEAEEADTICVINRGKIVSYGTPEQIKSDLIDEYLLLDADDRERLRTELQRSEVLFTETPQFKIPLNGIRPQLIIKAIDTPLSVLQVHMPTLEDAYLAIVARHAEGEEDGEEKEQEA